MVIRSMPCSTFTSWQVLSKEVTIIKTNHGEKVALVIHFQLLHCKGFPIHAFKEI